MSVFKGEAVTGELSKLLDEIKLCQEKEYSFEDLSHTISDHFLDNFSKISEEELMTSGIQTKLNVVSKMRYKDGIFSNSCSILYQWIQIQGNCCPIIAFSCHLGPSGGLLA